MNNDELFLHTLEDLEEHTAPGASEYEVLMSSGLLRKLLLDGGQSVVDQVNRRRQLPITFWINEPGEYENKILSDGPSLGRSQMVDPNTALVTGNSVTVNRDRFMGRRMVVNRGIEYSVADVIQATANVSGGIHAGVGKKERLRVLGQLDSELQIGGVGAVVRALPPIARVIRRGLDPFWLRVRQDHGLL